MVVLRIFCNILIFPDRLFPFIIVVDMSSFRVHLRSPLDRGNQTGASRPPAPTPPYINSSRQLRDLLWQKGRRSLTRRESGLR